MINHYFTANLLLVVVCVVVVVDDATKLSIDCLRAGETNGTIVNNGESKLGRFNDEGLIGSTVDKLGTSGIFFFSTFSGSGGFTFECLAIVHPFILRNSVKSTLFFLQHVHPL